MELTYKTLGADGQEYGPINLGQIQSWINEGRVGPESQVLRSDRADWRPASQYGEFLWDAPKAAAQPVPAVDPVAAQAAVLEKRIRAGGSWFYWIAGLSAVNTGLILSGSNTVFIFGLAITQIIDALAAKFGGLPIGIALDVAVVAVFVVFGVFACRRKTWSFVTGMVVYALDGLLTVLAEDWLSLGFHVFALFCIVSGFKAHRQLCALQRAAAQGPVRSGP
jgi:hypothetical protein